MELTADPDLLARFRAGERAVLGRVFEAYAPQVARWLATGFSYRVGADYRWFRGFSSTPDVHDALQDVFRAAFEGRARQAYSGVAPYEGYLFAIARNIALRRASAALRVMRDVTALPELSTDDPTPEEAVAAEEVKEAVRAFLRTLKSDQLRFISLRFEDGCSQAVVGDQLGWSRKKVRLCEGDIRARLSRFLRRHRGFVERMEDEAPAQRLCG